MEAFQENILLGNKLVLSNGKKMIKSINKDVQNFQAKYEYLLRLVYYSIYPGVRGGEGEIEFHHIF